MPCLAAGLSVLPGTTDGLPGVTSQFNRWRRMWLWEEGHAEQQGHQQVPGRGDADAWTEDFDYMLRLSVRRRHFDWALVEKDMRQYAECVAATAMHDAAPPADVSATALRKRWAHVDSHACEFYCTRLVRKQPRVPPAAAVTARAETYHQDAAALQQEEPQPQQPQRLISEVLSLPTPGVTDIAPAMDRILDSLDLDALLSELEARQTC